MVAMLPTFSTTGSYPTPLINRAMKLFRCWPVPGVTYKLYDVHHFRLSGSYTKRIVQGAESTFFQRSPAAVSLHVLFLTSVCGKRVPLTTDN